MNQLLMGGGLWEAVLSYSYQETTLWGDDIWPGARWQEGGTQEGILAKSFSSMLKASAKALEMPTQDSQFKNQRRKALCAWNTVRKWENHGSDDWRG